MRTEVTESQDWTAQPPFARSSSVKMLGRRTIVMLEEMFHDE